MGRHSVHSSELCLKPIVDARGHGTDARARGTDARERGTDARERRTDPERKIS